MSYNSEEIAISVKNVQKIYKIFDTPGKRFLYHMFHTKSGQDFVALRDVSFEVKKGESFGIIGKNGSGKSTMLQILAGILKQTSGEVKVNGRVAALLELGSGFNPESTGYENIYMNAAILGIKKDEIKKKVQGIVEFADIGDFINQPVKTYSSGMYIRLAFAVAINVDADILLIDEALAVGDVFFRQKCYSKLNQLKEEGKTIVLVSHGMNEVEQFCDKVLLLNHSEVLMCGKAKDAVQQYYLLDYADILKSADKEEVDENGMSEEHGSIKESKNGNMPRITKFDEWELKDNVFCDLEGSHENGDGGASFLYVGLFNKDGRAQYVFEQGEEAFFYAEVLLNEDVECPTFGVALNDQRNIIVHGKDTTQYETRTDHPTGLKKNTRFAALQRIKLDVAVGEYTFDIGCTSISRETFENRANYSQDLINLGMHRLCSRGKVGVFSVHEHLEGKPTKIEFHGICNLPGDIQIIADKKN